MQLHDIIKERILILDGAMGTMIQRLGLTEEDFRGERFAARTFRSLARRGKARNQRQLS